MPVLIYTWMSSDFSLHTQLLCTILLQIYYSGVVSISGFFPVTVASQISGKPCKLIILTAWLSVSSVHSGYHCCLISEAKNYCNTKEYKCVKSSQGCSLIIFSSQILQVEKVRLVMWSVCSPTRLSALCRMEYAECTVPNCSHVQPLK